MCRLSHARRGTAPAESLTDVLVGLIVLDVALQLILLARVSYQRVADSTLIEGRGTRALELLTMALQHAGWATDTPAASPEHWWPNARATPSIQGTDNYTPPETEVLDCNGSGTRNSDAVLVRFVGHSMHANPQ